MCVCVLILCVCVCVCERLQEGFSGGSPHANEIFVKSILKLKRKVELFQTHISAFKGNIN